MYPPHSSNSVAEIVRAERTWAGIAAVLLCYYGYYVSLPGSTFAEGLFCYTLRFGGPALVLSVLLLQTGKLFALAYDGVISILIGVGLAISSVLWLMRGGGGFQTYLNLFFGVLFFNAGWRNWKVWAQMQSIDLTEPRRPSAPIAPPTHDSPPSDSLAGRIKQQRRSETQPIASPPEITPPVASSAQPESPAPPAAETPPDPTSAANVPSDPTPQIDVPREANSSQPPSSLESRPPLSSSTEGFLASFADPDDENKST